MDKYLDELKDCLDDLKTLIVEDVMWKNAIDDEDTYNSMIGLFKTIDTKTSSIRAYHTKYLNIFNNNQIPGTYEEIKECLAACRDSINESTRIIHHWKTLENFLKENPTAQCEWDRFMATMKLSGGADV
jgi:hypothetical protein